jgi:endonuclease YncB( thermonuclease family)
MPNGFDRKYYLFRLAGIDTPEIKDPALVAQYLAYHAAEFLKTQIESAGFLRFDIKSKTDFYGRLLGTIFADEIDINQKMIDNKFAIKFEKTDNIREKWGLTNEG